jgi:GntR family transcriptional regulator/MocR family aminotransferase
VRTTAGGFSPLITLDRSLKTPLHRQIYDAIRACIIRRSLQSGQQIPSSRVLAQELGISRIPVLGAYGQLLAEGYFESRHGAGTFVSRSLPDELTSCEHRTAEPNQGPSGPRRLSRRSALLPLRGNSPWLFGTGAFSVGQLAFDHFPFQIWSNLVARHARKVRASSLNYGEPVGSAEFREAIATYLRTARAVDCDARQIMIVSGSQQALDLSARVLLDPGSPVWVEEPGYEMLRSALTLAGSRLIPVPVDGEGMDVAAGIKLCRHARVAFVTPSHQFPLGVTMSASRRLQLLNWAHQAGSWVVEDDYDSEYRYESLPIASLQGLDHGRRVIYVGTFSKTLFPSLRLGYLVIPPDLVDRFVAVRRAMDVCSPHFNQIVLADFIDQGHFARHVRKTRMIYQERRTALVRAIHEEFGSTLQVLGGEAGMHLAVTLPECVGAVQKSLDREISVQAAAQKLWLWPLSASYLGTPLRQGFILGFGSTKASDVALAVRRLKRVIDETHSLDIVPA